MLHEESELTLVRLRGESSKWGFQTRSRHIIVCCEPKEDVSCCGPSRVEKNYVRWIDGEDNPFMDIVPDEGRSCTVYFPCYEVAGGVRLGLGYLISPHNEVIATFKRDIYMDPMTTYFTRVSNNQNIAVMSHMAQKGIGHFMERSVHMQFTSDCSTDLKVLIMAAAILFRKLDADEEREREIEEYKRRVRYNHPLCCSPI